MWNTRDVLKLTPLLALAKKKKKIQFSALNREGAYVFLQLTIQQGRTWIKNINKSCLTRMSLRIPICSKCWSEPGTEIYGFGIHGSLEN